MLYYVILYITTEPIVVIMVSHSCFHDCVRLMKVYLRLLLFVMYVTDDNRDGRGYVYGPFNLCYRGSCSDKAGKSSRFV